MKKANMFGVAAICIGIAALITSIGTSVVNVLTLKWAARIYEPFDRMIRRSEPLVNKTIDYGEREADEWFKKNEKKYVDDED